MSMINPQNPQGDYYRLNQSGGAGVNARSSRSASPVSVLLGNGSEINTAWSGNSAYQLDLSPAAQQYLSQVNSQNQLATKIGDQGFILSSKQRTIISEVVARFADAPYTQETFDLIQDALQQEGVGPNQLSAKYRASSFNSTATLIDALSGGKGKIPGSVPVSNQELQQRSEQYVSFIAAQWRDIRTEPQEAATVDDTSDALTADAVASTESRGGA